MSSGAVTASDLLTSLGLNVVTSVIFLILYLVGKNLPLFFRVYYPRRYLKGQIEHVEDLVGSGDKKQHELGWRSFRYIWNWIWSSWRLTQSSEFIERYGLDSAVLLRSFLLGYDSYINLAITI